MIQYLFSYSTSDEINKSPLIMLILIMLFPNIIVTKNLALVWHEYNNPVIQYQIFLLQY